MKKILIFLFLIINFSYIGMMEKNTITIKVALLNSAIPSFTSPKEMMEILNGYSWQTKTTSYRFEVRWITDYDICNGELKNFDALIIPGIGKEFWRIFDGNLSLWKNEIRDFVRNGGGYFGTCGGANLAGYGILNAEKRGWKRMTAWEYFMNASALHLLPFKSYQDMADPFASSLIWKNPSRLGQSAYIWYNLSINGTGVCHKCWINTNHPIFYGCNDERIIRWVGGPALIPFKNVTIIARYPLQNLSNNANTTIHAWRFKFGIIDSWDMTDDIIKTHLAGRPAALEGRYGKGIVVVFGNHPEHPVWEGGKIFEIDTNSNHLFFKGLFQWRDRKFLPQSYNWWIVRRSVAWVAGIDGNELPPVEL